MASINVRISQRPYLSRRNNRNMRKRSVHNLIPISVLKPGPPSAKLIPKCLALNARSLVKPDAASALCTEVTTNKIDVCLYISETWLNRNVPSSLICPDELLLSGKIDWTYDQVVVLQCYVERIEKLINLITMIRSYECSWCEIQVKNNNKYYVAAIYNPPNPTWNPIYYLSECCEQILISDLAARIMIAGDVNNLRISEFSRQHNLEQLVKRPARGKNTLDVFLTNCPHIWKSPTMFMSLVRSDHLAIREHEHELKPRENMFILEM